MDCGISWIEHISSMVPELDILRNNFFEEALSDSSVQTNLRLRERVENWISPAIRKNIPFIRSKKRSSNSLFLGHNSETCLAPILFFSLECSQLFHSRKTTPFFGSNVCREECEASDVSLPSLFSLSAPLDGSPLSRRLSWWKSALL